MALSLQISSLRQATVLVCQGIIVFGEEADSLRAQVKELLRQNEPSAPGPSVVPGLYLVLDLSRVLYIDSGGLGALVGLLTSIRAAGGDLKLAGLNERIERVLKTTHLNQVFQIYASAEEAVEAFHAGAAVQK